MTPPTILLFWCKTSMTITFSSLDHPRISPRRERSETNSQNAQVPPEPERTLPKRSVHLERIPEVYRHEKCNQRTVMPERVIWIYLVDPCYFNQLRYCSHCKRCSHAKEFVWTETGENLHEYHRRIYAGKSVGYKALNWATSWLGCTLFGVFAGLSLAAIGFVRSEVLLVIIALLGFVIGVGPIKYLRLAIAYWASPDSEGQTYPLAESRRPVDGLP